MPEPRRKARKRKLENTPLPAVPVEELSRLHLFRDIPRNALLLLQGRVRKAVAEANETILELSQHDEVFRYFFFVAQGQVSVVGYDEAARSKPLNFLRKGEFFVDKSVAWGEQVATKITAITSTELLMLPREELKLLAQQHPPFHDKLRRLTERIDYRNRIYSEDSYARSVLEFLVETGLTQASRVKITQLDKCIECDTCYKSCEDRHGFQRLERGYARFGVLDFAKSCLTCFYPTCIPACPVDAIVFDTQKGEVDILDSCIGVSACVRGCPYGAIKMFKVDREDTLYQRFLAPDKKIKPKYIADKCNHCFGYDDLACITNCPTDAILEVEATDLLENPRIFGAHESGWKVLPSLIKQRPFAKFMRKFYIFLGLILTGWLIWEALVLNKLPGLSPLFRLQQMGFIPASFSLTFKRGSDFCWFLGNLGFLLILVGLLYPLRKVFPRLFKYLGRKPLWLDFHNFCGALGTILVLFHTGFVFPLSVSTFGFLALVAVTISGVYGRFLYTMIPRGVAGTELKMSEIEEEDQSVSQKLDALFRDSSTHRVIINRLIKALTEEAKQTAHAGSILKSVIKTKYLLWRLRFRLPEEIRINERQIGNFIELLQEKVRLQRNVAFLKISSKLFRQWQYIHRPLAYVMSALVIGHVVYNTIFFTGN